MIKPRLLSKEEQRLNNRLWELRIKYNDIDDFDEGIDDIILGKTPEEFAIVTKQFKTPADYAEALAIMSQHINRGKDVPEVVWKKIKQTREDFKAALTLHQ